MSLVLVYSRMTALITYYIVTIPQLADIGVATVSDAFHLPLGPDSRLGHCRFDPLRDQQKIGFVLMSLLPLSYEEAQMEDYEDADMDTQTEIKFFQLWGLSGNLSLTERLCTFTKSLQEANELSITRKPCHIETPRTRNGRGFIVPDGYLSDGEGCVQPRLWMSRHSRRNRFKRTNMVGHRGHTINMRWTRRICQRVADLRAAEQSKSQSMKSLDAALERFNEVRNDLPPGIHTL